MLCLVVYGLTAHWYGIVNVDTEATAWPGWELVHHGRLWLEDEPRLPVNPWFEQHHGHLVSNRMAGVVLIGVPAQALLAGFDLHPLTPAVLTGVVVTALAMANLALLLRRLGTDARVALGVTAAVAFGTGMWTNAGAELWAHGPDVLFLSTAMLALQRDRQWLAGLWLAPTLWTRPHLAVVAAAVGLRLALSDRSLRPLLRIGLPTSVALAGLVAWNDRVFGEPSIGGGYAAHNQILSDSGSSAFRAFGESALGSFVSPLHGALVYSPFLLVGIAALCLGWRLAPGWPRACVAGGVAYQLMQFKLNGFTGGEGLYSYRLPLELIVLCTPMAALGYVQRIAPVRPWRLVTRLLVGASVAVHVIGVFWYQPLAPGGQFVDAWRTWGTWTAVTARGASGAVTAVVAGLVVLALASVRLPRPRPD